ncbi:MAG: metallophosphoesterase family protein, partial [bacterium]
MRIAILSDIHGNLEALEAVLEHLSGESVDRVVCLGDLVGYGADPNPCCARI